MVIKSITFLIGILFFISCSDSEESSISNEIFEPKNLQEYISANTNIALEDVIACAASKDGSPYLSYIIYYPIPTATNIQYFETNTIDVDKDNFELYIPLQLEKEDFFNGYLERFVRNDASESWCVVTYETEGKVHVSNPIRLKNASKPTEWTDKVTINTQDALMPQFIWEDGTVVENAIYFQVISDVVNNFISGTYTFDKWFQFYKLDNVVLNITDELLPVLNSSEEYNFTMMGVSEDNWVNLVVQKTFIAK